MYGGGALGGGDGGGSDGGEGGDGGGGDGGGASTEIAAITGAETCSIATPSARLRVFGDVVLSVMATELAAVAFSMMMLSATLTLAAVTSTSIRSVCTPAPSMEAMEALKACMSKLSTVPARRDTVRGQGVATHGQGIREARAQSVLVVQSVASLNRALGGGLIAHRHKQASS